MDPETKKSEIEVYDGSGGGRSEYGSLWDEDHHNRLLELGPEGEFARLLDSYATGDVLVLGCGTGTRARQIASQEGSRRVIGIELSQSRLETAVQDTESTSFIRADAEELSFRSDSFDTVVAHSILHHLPNWQADGMREIMRVLRDNGVLLFYEPGRYNPPAALRRTLLPSAIHTPDEQPFDPLELYDVLTAHFSSVEMNGHCLFSNVLPVLDGKLPVSLPFYLTRNTYNLEKRLFELVGHRSAWILCGHARL